jgi:hypothetical protein
MVKLANGMTTTVEAAIAAGLLVDGNPQPRGPVASSFNGGPSGALPEAPQANPEGNRNATEQAPNAAPEGSTISTSQEAASAITAGAQALQAATEAIGATAVTAFQHDVVTTGNLPTQLPDGISQDQVNAVAGAYVAQANALLKETGATVDGLVKMLNPSELRQARIAAFQNNDAQLKELGHRAMSRLTTLPDDPVLLKELTADWPADVKITQRDGKAWVETAAWQMSWADAVNAKKIWFG